MGMTGIDRKFQDLRQGRMPLLTVLVLVLVAVLPIIILRDFTPSNELRYLSIADESLATGRWWAFTNHGIPYADKPPLYLWCIILGKWLLGSHQMWFYSLFSIIPAFVIAGVMYRWTWDELDIDFRPSALLMLFTCGLFAGMVFTLRMDMLMTMFIVLALHRFRLLEKSEDKPKMGARLLFALWIFLAVFSKGPMGILIPLLATTVWLFLTRRMRLWTRAWGWPTWGLLILLCAGWFGAVYAEGGTEYLDNLLVHQTVGRAVNSFHHKRPFWYYLVSLTYTTQPWTFLIFGSLVYAVRKYRRTHDSLLDYFLVIVLTTFVLLSVISSKLQVYMLPAYPFMVYLAVMICARNKDSRLIAAGVAIPAGILGLTGVAAALASIFGGFFAMLGAAFSEAGFLLPPTAVVLVAGSVLTFRLLYRKAQLAAAINMLSETVLALVFLAGFAVSVFNADTGYKAISDKALEMKGKYPSAEIMTWKIRRPENIDVYLKDVPFRIVEDTDSMKTMEVPAYPAIIMTTGTAMEGIPGIRDIHHVGSNYVVLFCDTIEKR